MNCLEYGVSGAWGLGCFGCCWCGLPEKINCVSFLWEFLIRQHAISALSLRNSFSKSTYSIVIYQKADFSRQCFACFSKKQDDDEIQTIWTDRAERDLQSPVEIFKFLQRSTRNRKFSLHRLRLRCGSCLDLSDLWWSWDPDKFSG